MTITNHLRDIETLATETVHHVDRKEYHRAHLRLDEIENKARLAHRHIDHLQNVTDFAARPAGDDGT